MIIGEWIGLGSLMVANVGLVYVTYNHFSKKIGRVYERFDEYKNHMEGTVDAKFVQKDLCAVMHQTNADNLTGIETRLTIALHQLEKKVDDNFRVVIDMMKK
jgi:hypothetical protein